MDELQITLAFIKELSELSPESLKEWEEKSLEIMAGKPEGEKYVKLLVELVQMGGVERGA